MIEIIVALIKNAQFQRYKWIIQNKRRNNAKKRKNRITRHQTNNAKFVIVKKYQ